MNITFLGQGYEPESKNSVGNHLLNILSKKEFHTFTAITAFASEAGVIGLADHIVNAKKNFKQLNLIVGIDQEGTSKEALAEINKLKINSYIFYQKEPPIFHPKVYLFEGVKETKLILGSSNMTSRGLFGNVESSLLVEFLNTDKMGMNLLAELKEYYRDLFNFTDPNLFKISKKTIKYFVDKGIVPDEIIRQKKYGKQVLEREGVDEGVGLEIPKRSTANIPKEFRGSRKTKAKTTAATAFVVGGVFEKGELIWESGKLTERPLNIPKGNKTNATGSMYFTKGKMKDIDQRHYFRDTVFKTLKWKKDDDKKYAHLERAMAFFKIIIDGYECGRFELILTHNTLKNTATYRQNNSMTQVSWGEAKKFIAKEELIGKTAKLFKTKKEREFILEIS